MNRMTTQAVSKRWVGSLIALAVASFVVWARGAEPGASHASEDPAQQSGGYLRERVGSVTPPVTSYVETGEISPKDDLFKRLSDDLVRSGVMPETKTGEKPESEESTLAKNQKRPGLAEPTPVPVF